MPFTTKRYSVAIMFTDIADSNNINDLNKTRLYLEFVYNNIFHISETIKKYSYKKSFLTTGMNNEIMELGEDLL